MNLDIRRKLFYVLYFLQIFFLIFVWWQNSGPRVKIGGGQALISLGGLFGLMAGFFFLYQMILISGTKFFERSFGLDRLARIHHTTGLVGYGFLIAHVLFIITGYMALTGNNFIAQYFELKNSLPYILLATISLILLDLVIVTSIVIVRKRLKYEFWYFVHLLVYFAVLLAFFHQVANGQNLLSSKELRTYWYGLYFAAFGLVLWRRWFLPIYLEFKFKFRVKKVVRENNSVVSIYVEGKDISRFKYDAGQFNLWQFWQKGLRTMHHPFTISSSPGDSYLRLSAKAIGDFTKKLDKLEKGTPVLISGPYGLFSNRVSTRKNRLFIAGGIGITPILSILRSGVQPNDVLIYAAQTIDDAVFSDVFLKLKEKGLKTIFVLSQEKVKGTYEGYLSGEILDKEINGLKDRDIWLCGPPPMMKAVEKLLDERKMPKSQIHTEKFRL